MKAIITLAAILLSAPSLSCAQLSKDAQSSVVFLLAPGKCSGTGFFVSGSTIITASHVAKTTRLEVHIGGRRYYATVQKRNAAVDYCELRISGYTCPKPLKWGNAEIGDMVFTYGYPTERMESSCGEIGWDYLWGRWDCGAQAQNGMSGGPVSNKRGEVVGIVTDIGFGGRTMFRATREVGK